MKMHQTFGRMALLPLLLGALAPLPAEADSRWRGGVHIGIDAGHYHGGYGRWHGGPYWRPHVGLHVHGLPALRTLVVVGGITYLLANGVYYREAPEGGYVVVPPPVQPPAEPVAPPRQFVYPRQGQAPQQQDTDEYECHRWAARQSGFDPAAAATGQDAGEGRRSDYQRARGACLEGRGYTVR